MFFRGSLAVYPPDHERLKSRQYPLSTDEQTGAWVLRIMPYPINKEWAGIFITHELSHLYSHVLEGEPKNPPKPIYDLGEIKAYNTELFAVNQVSNNRLIPEIVKFLKGGNYSSLDDFLNSMVVNDWAELEKLKATLDPLITSAKEKSIHEKALKDAFYLISAGFIYVNQTAKSEEEKVKEYLKVYNKVKLLSEATRGGSLIYTHLPLKTIYKTQIIPVKATAKINRASPLSDFGKI